MFSLVSFFGQDDSDILPFFLQHYRNLGVCHFHIYIHGDWTREELAPLRGGDVTLAGIVQTPFDVMMKSAAVEAHARTLESGWLLLVDADEFLEVPYDTLTETVAALDRMGLDELPSILLQRASADGRLPALSAGADLDALFPAYDFRLAERMSVPYPIWKNKYPLVRAGLAGLRVSRGYHLPLTGHPSAHIPIRGTLHHFKWRDRLLRSIARIRGQGSNQREQDAYRNWLAEHDQHLPTDGLRPLSRAALFADGHLVRPKKPELARLAALARRGAASAPSAAEEQKRLRSLAAVAPAAVQVDPRALPLLDRRGALAAPGRIALVTSDILGLRRSGGIGTAIAGLAERLSAAGHEVHVFLSPYADFPIPHPTWIEYWEARGVRVHHIARDAESGRILTAEEMALVLCEALAQEEWDVIHLPEAGGLGTAIENYRAAGLAFASTRIVVTVHGPTRWHRSGNFLPWTNYEAEITELETQSVDLADVLVFPSAYMLDWSRRHFAIVAPALIIPNALTGDSRTFGRLAGGRRPIRRLVFFGRIELRKGVDRFIAAVEQVLASGLDDFEAIFLGSFGQKFSEADLARRTQHWTCRKRFLVNYTTHDAMELLRSEDCLAVIPSRLDNSPYTVYECLENGIPFIASDVGGVPELIAAEDRGRVLVGGEADDYAAKLIEALTEGAKPARMSFDPFQADLDLLALHGNLVEAARADRGTRRAEPLPSASLVLYGSGDIGPDFALTLRRWASEGHEVLLASDPADPAAPDAARLNRLARSAAHGQLLFCNLGVTLRPETLAALQRTLEASRADAVVCGFEAPGRDGAVEITPVYAGPAELAITRNVFGAKAFLIHRQSFLEAGGFAEEQEIGELFEWELLNRLKAAGRRIAAIPAAMAFLREPAVRHVPSDYQTGRLAAPWAALATGPLQGLVRMALHPERKAGPANASPQAAQPPAASRQAPADLRGLELAGLLAQRSGTAAETGRGAPVPAPGTAAASAPPPAPPAGRSIVIVPPEEGELAFFAPIDIGRLRLEANGDLVEGAEPYVVREAEDAEGCDFHVADDGLEGGECDDMTAAFRDIVRWLGRGGEPAFRTGGFLHFEEILAASPCVAARIAVAARRLAEGTARFYDCREPLFPASIVVTQSKDGGFAPPRRPIALPRRATGEDRPPFSGLLHLNDDMDGGESYFTALDILVQPRRGRFVGTTNSPYHERAALRVRSGAALTLAFAMSRSPEVMSRALRRLY